MPDEENIFLSEGGNNTTWRSDPLELGLFEDSVRIQILSFSEDILPWFKNCLIVCYNLIIVNPRVTRLYSIFYLILLK